MDKSKDAKKRKSGPATPADVKGAKKKPPGDPKQPQGFDRGLEPERIIGKQIFSLRKVELFLNLEDLNPSE